MVAVQINLSTHRFSFALFSLGLCPFGPSSPCCCSMQRRAGRHSGGHAEKKHFLLGFSSEAGPKCFPIYTMGANFVYQKGGIQDYSLRVIHLPCGHFLDLKSMSCTLRSCSFLYLNSDLRLNVKKTEENCSLKDSADCLLKGEMAVVDIQTLRYAYSYSPGRFCPHTLACPLAQMQGYRKLAQTYLNQQASCRQHLSPTT